MTKKVMKLIDHTPKNHSVGHRENRSFTDVSMLWDRDFCLYRTPDMKFSKKLMKSHSDKYRMLQIPHSIASIWIEEGIENVTVEYVEKKGYLIVRPIKAKPKAAEATVQVSASAKVVKQEDHSAAQHFGFE